MADALVSPAVAGVMYACSIAAAGFAVKRTKDDTLERKIPLMGIMGAFVFAAQMINFTIPGTGSSGHLCGGMMLSAILGPSAAFLTMIAILLIQCLLFADGGILALGCNVWNMAFYGCFVGGYLIWRLFTSKGLSRGRIALASVAACIISLELGAFSVTLETLCSGITELPFGTFLGFMMPIHLVIGLVEGLVTAAVLIFIFETRPDLLSTEAGSASASGRLSGRTVAGILAGVAVAVGGLLSLFASSYPDGLEWSLSKVTGSTELEAGDSAIHAIAEGAQSVTSLLPDYAIEGSDSAIGTSLSGIAGSLTVLVLCIAVSLLIRRFRPREKNS